MSFHTTDEKRSAILLCANMKLSFCRTKRIQILTILRGSPQYYHQQRAVLGIVLWNIMLIQCGFQEVVSSLVGLSMVPSSTLIKILSRTRKPRSLLQFPEFRERTKQKKISWVSGHLAHWYEDVPWTTFVWKFRIQLYNATSLLNQI